jgi:hypothetical protein
MVTTASLNNISPRVSQKIAEIWLLLIIFYLNKTRLEMLN